MRWPAGQRSLTRPGAPPNSQFPGCRHPCRPQAFAPIRNSRLALTDASPRPLGRIIPQPLFRYPPSLCHALALLQLMAHDDLGVPCRISMHSGCRLLVVVVRVMLLHVRSLGCLRGHRLLVLHLHRWCISLRHGLAVIGIPIWRVRGGKLISTVGRLRPLPHVVERRRLLLRHGHPPGPLPSRVPRRPRRVACRPVGALMTLRLRVIKSHLTSIYGVLPMCHCFLDIFHIAERDKAEPTVAAWSFGSLRNEHFRNMSELTKIVREVSLRGGKVKLSHKKSTALRLARTLHIAILSRDCSVHDDHVLTDWDLLLRQHHITILGVHERDESDPFVVARVGENLRHVEVLQIAEMSKVFLQMRLCDPLRNLRDENPLARVVLLPRGWATRPLGCVGVLSRPIPGALHSSKMGLTQPHGHRLPVRFW
mmetsp:Transcript_57655/g.154044  ORF Transcript_57655/g.154044 Transcript_57655/m.154044 type:complete len:423 (+) Transcript_57655:2-1270(+)